MITVVDNFMTLIIVRLMMMIVEKTFSWNSKFRLHQAGLVIDIILTELMWSHQCINQIKKTMNSPGTQYQRSIMYFLNFILILISVSDSSTNILYWVTDTISVSSVLHISLYLLLLLLSHCYWNFIFIYIYRPLQVLRKEYITRVTWFHLLTLLVDFFVFVFVLKVPITITML